MSHPAASLTAPSAAGKTGTSSRRVTTPSASARAITWSARAGETTGLVKNEPTLRRFGSAGSSTIDLRRRSASTAARVSASVGLATAASACRSSG